VVAAAAAVSTPMAVVTAGQTDMKASTSTNGKNASMMAPSTASTLACTIWLAFTGAVAIRSGASSPEMASQASPPASWLSRHHQHRHDQGRRLTAAAKAAPQE
jgi:hypothetical protein